METIKQYLDAMFAGLPNTASVLKARDELSQMMEDKYTELIGEGKSENEAVGTVISEFGNLSELAEELGLKEEVDQKIQEDIEVPKRAITSEEVERYLHVNADSTMKRSIGIGLCIMSIGFLITISSLSAVTGFSNNATSAIGVLAMFAAIAAGVVLIVKSNTVLREFAYLRKEPCSISMDITKNLHAEKARANKNTSLLKTVGILLCVFCWTPSVLSDLLNSGFIEDLAGASIFYLCGLGVLMLVYSAQTTLGYDSILKLNGKETISGNYVAKAEKKVEYENPVAAFVMSVFWPTVVCLYLIISFITLMWAWTWVIWPVAVILFNVFRIVFKKVEE